MSAKHKIQTMYDQSDVDEIVDETSTHVIFTVLEALIENYGITKIQDCFNALSDQ